MYVTIVFHTGTEKINMSWRLFLFFPYVWTVTKRWNARLKELDKNSNSFFFFFFFVIFFLSGFSFTDTKNLQDSRGREGTFIYSTLPLPPTHKHSGIYLQFSMWDDYRVFLIATLVFTRLLLDEICHLNELPFDWLIDEAMFVCLLNDLILGFLLQQFDTWIWTRIDYHPCITSEPSHS